ncbi:MAG: hypothetical protein Q8S09_04490 [Hyphomonas sp.]|nr:hypothetical protein [Hyphomonas sp.]
MFNGKSNEEVLVSMAMKGMLPLMAQRIASSPRAQAIVKAAAEADAFAAEANRKIDAIQKSVTDRYREMGVKVAELLTETGLAAIVDEFGEARAALAAEAKPAAE